MSNEHWVETTIGSLCFTTSGGTPSRTNKNYYKGEIPWIKSGELKDDIIYDSEEHISTEALSKSTAKVFEKGTILIALYGATIGKLGILGSKAATNQAICAIYKSNALENKFLFLYLLSQHENLTRRAFGAAQPNISQQTIKNYPIFLPPLNEQKRIVQKLDGILPKVRSSKARLDKIPAILKRFRQSVLAAACSGRLTEDWREENPEIESADEMFFNMKQKREKEYLAKCKEAKDNGQKKPQKYFRFDIPDVYNTLDFDLPNRWSVSNIDFLAHVTKLAGFEYTKYIKLSEKGEIPAVRAQNVQMGRFVNNNILFIEKSTSDFLERSQLHNREILMVFIGAGTGNVCLAPETGRWHLAPNVAKIDCDYVYNKYINFYLQSHIGLASTLSFMKETAQPSLSMETIRQVFVIVPPLAEQREIVQRVEKLFHLADSLEVKYQKALARIIKLEQAVLAKAFRGELADPNPNDEPAEILLQRILAEKAQHPTPTRKGRTRTRRKTATGRK